jgi:hypothetical protein
MPPLYPTLTDRDSAQALPEQVGGRVGSRAWLSCFWTLSASGRYDVGLTRNLSVRVELVPRRWATSLFARRTPASLADCRVVRVPPCEATPCKTCIKIERQTSFRLSSLKRMRLPSGSMTVISHAFQGASSTAGLRYP